MHILYSDDKEKFSGKPIPYNELPATMLFLRHFSNFLYLKFIHDNTEKFFEKVQANKEIQIAEKKMSYWKKHPNFSTKEAEKAMSEERKKWNG